jgi:AcrR family transcriptional regulator
VATSPTGRPGNRGRRPGAPDTRTEILASARALFADRGFGGTTIRAVAAEAGVDPSLVHHFFGSKDDLFMAALELPVDPRVLLAPVVAAGAEGAGARLLETFLGVWDDPENQLTFLGLFRSVLEPDGGRLLSQGFVPVVLGPVGEALGLDRPEVRMPLVASQMIGLIMCRYVLRLEPLASMEPTLLVATYAPTIQRYLTGELPLDDPEGRRV